MSGPLLSRRRALVGLGTAALIGCATGRRGAGAPQLSVLSSGGLTAAYLALGPTIERELGCSLTTAFGASMGEAPDAIPVRLARGEVADLVLMAEAGLVDLIAAGRVVGDSRIDLARSSIGMVVRAGAPKPDISTVESFTQAMLDAESIAYSASASGRYISTELFPRLGIAEQVADKSARILSERVGTVVARGDAELGFQQISELLPIEGVDFVGPLPDELQHTTIFCGGVLSVARAPQLAHELLAFMASPAAAAAVRESGLEPIIQEMSRGAG